MKRLLLVLALGCLVMAARATTIIPMSVEELTRAAAAIVEARAVRSWSQWNAQHTLIYTYTEFAVGRAWKGTPAQSVTVKQLGGSAGGYMQKVSGVRGFSQGEQAILFLRPSEARDGSMVVVGLVQGNFRVFQDANGQRMASNGVNGVETVRNGRVSVFRGAPVSVRDLESRVRAVPQ